MFKLIIEWFKRRRRNRAKIEMIEKLQRLEEERLGSHSWSLSIELIIEILNLIDPKLLDPQLQDLKSRSVYIGFKHVAHLYDWLLSIQRTVNNRETVTYDMMKFQYERKVMTMDDFLLNEKQERYPAELLHYNLLGQLKVLNDSINSIQDQRYKDRLIATINPALVELFVIAESLAILGAR